MRSQAASITYKFLPPKLQKDMCYKVECKQCKRYSWGGCGNHLTTVYASIDKGNHCMCKSWPGVVIPTEETATESGSSSTSATTTTAAAQKSKR